MAQEVGFEPILSYTLKNGIIGDSRPYLYYTELIRINGLTLCPESETLSW